MADTKTNFKITKLAKDMGLKGKDLVDILAKHGKEVTAQKALEPAEFDILFDAVTRDNQVEDIDSYLDGKTVIPSKKKPAKAEAKAEKKEPEEAAKAAPKAEPVAEAPKAEEKAEKSWIRSRISETKWNSKMWLLVPTMKLLYSGL